MLLLCFLLPFFAAYKAFNLIIENRRAAAVVFGALSYVLERFKAVLRRFNRQGCIYTALHQKAEKHAHNGVIMAYRHRAPIQVKQKTATAARLLSSFHYVVLKTTKHSFNKYLWLIVSNPTIYCGFEKS